MAEEAAKSRGNSAFSSGNFTESITHFTEAIKISPNNHILYSNRSAAYASLSNFTQALSDAKKTVQIKPDWSKGYSRLGAAYAGLKNYSQAVSSYEKGLKLDPNNEALKSGLSDAESAKTKDELLKELKSAHSVEEMLKVFKQMESLFDESELGYECFVVAEKVSDKGKDFEQVLSFGKRALTSNFKRTGYGSHLLIADVLCLLGSTCLELEKFDESLGFLNRAERSLSRVGSEKGTRRVLDSKLYIETELCNVKAVLGKREETVVHSKKILEIKEKIMGKGCVELGLANKDVSIACIAALDLKGALPYCLRAIEIYTKCLGGDSIEMAELTRHLSVIYREMGEHDKALGLNRVATTALRKASSDSTDMHLLTAETEGANSLIDLGRYEEAVEILKGVVSHDDMNGPLQVKAFITMARALCFWGKFSDAKKYMSRVVTMLEEKELDPVMVAIGFADIPAFYKKMNDFEAAIPFMKRAVALPGLPQKLLPELCAGLMSLIVKYASEKEQVPYMVDEVEKLKVSFGPKHCVVGFAYSNLGVAYLGSGQYELGVKSMANAKDILDVALGPHHLTSMKISMGLSVAYGILERYHQSLEIVEKVAEGLKGLAPSELGFMHEVVNHLNDMKERVAELPTRSSSQFKDGEDLAAENSHCGTSDDGKGT